MRWTSERKVPQGQGYTTGAGFGVLIRPNHLAEQGGESVNPQWAESLMGLVRREDLEEER